MSVNDKYEKSVKEFTRSDGTDGFRLVIRVECDDEIRIMELEKKIGKILIEDRQKYYKKPGGFTLG